MTRILAIDTTSEHGSLALAEEGRVVEELLIHSPDGFGHVLFPQIDALMKRHGWAFSTITGFAAGAGPGSFTGVRVGLSAALGLAEACGTGAAAISNLRAMAFHGTQSMRAPFFDARRGEVYGGLYDASLAALRPETARPLEVWLAALPADAELLTADPEPFEMELAGRAVTVTPRGLAGAIARIGALELKDPILLDANYVRRSDAELNWKDPAALAGAAGRPLQSPL
jgi:tRNA threonylcarbamoyladenosine biosynthesis protein TsaB